MSTPGLALDVVRALTTPPELRAAASGGLGTMTGHFSEFNTWYRVSSVWEGEFMERVLPGAFEQTIREDRSGMRVLFDHGFDPQLGNKVLGPIEDLREDETGAYYEVPLFDTSYNRDLEPGLRSGVYGASFRMRVQEDSWVDEPDPSEHNPRGLPERSIIRTQTSEFGPVTFPASPGATASVRSATDHFYELLAAREPERYEAACRAAGRLPHDPTGRPSARRAGGGEHHPASSPRRGAADFTQMTPERRDAALRLEGIL